MSKAMLPIRVHDFSKYAKILGKIPGIALYPDRAALLPGVCYADRCGSDVLDDYLERYLRQIHIGADQIRFVDASTDLFHGILCDERNRDLLRAEMKAQVTSTTLEGFAACDRWDQFVADLGVSPEHLRTPTHSIMKILDDKEAIRRLALSFNELDLFPEHVFAYSADEVWISLQQFRSRFPNLVVLKRPDLESGVGQLLVRPDTTDVEIAAYLATYGGSERPIIVEEGIPGVDGSLQWYISPDGYERRFVSRQYTQGGFHEGNVISPNGAELFPSDWPFSVRQDLIERAWLSTEPFVVWVKERGYLGPLGFDFMMNMYAYRLLECNARTTAATYLEGVRVQVQNQGHGAVCAAMRNAYPTTAKNWHEVLAIWQEHNLAYDPKTGHGVILGHPRLLTLEHPKCLAIAISNSVAEAEATLMRSLEIL